MSRELIMNNLKYFSLGLILTLVCTATYAANPVNIQILGLYRDKAAVKINGKQELLKLGVPTDSGVVLVRANANRAIIEVNGVQKTYGLGTDVSTRLTKPETNIVRIPVNQGIYLTQGFINGRSVDFLVDTGATVVAMSRITADNLLIPYREIGTPMKVSTASEISNAWSVKLASIKVGGITLHQVEGSVIDTPHDQPILLGMSFLNRVKFSQEQGVVVLEAKAN